MQQNVGTYDALLRITAGSLILSWAAGKRTWTTRTALIATYGAAKVAEGVTRHCLLNKLLGLTTVDDDGEKAVFRLGPIVYRRISRLPVRSLWGVRSEAEGDDFGYHAPSAVETSGWNWEGQPNND